MFYNNFTKMPTLKPLVFKQKPEEDRSFNVKIRITRNQESQYLATPLYIKGKQASNKFEIKVCSVLRKIGDDIDGYWSIVKNVPKQCLDRF